MAESANSGNAGASVGGEAPSTTPATTATAPTTGENSASNLTAPAGTDAPMAANTSAPPPSEQAPENAAIENSEPTRTDTLPKPAVREADDFDHKGVMKNEELQAAKMLERDVLLGKQPAPESFSLTEQQNTAVAAPETASEPSTLAPVQAQTELAADTEAAIETVTEPNVLAPAQLAEQKVADFTPAEESAIEPAPVEPVEAAEPVETEKPYVVAEKKRKN